MRKIGFIVIVIIAFALSVSGSNAQKKQGGAGGALKYGVVDVETIVKEMPEAADADAKLKEIGKQWQDTLMQLRKDMEAKYQQYQKQKAMMQAAQQQKEEEALQAMQMQAMQFQEEKFGNTGELSQMREKYLEPIRAKVKKAIEATAKEEDISLVLDKVGSIVLYSEDKNDITYKVLDKIKRGGK